jgi:hypothetical protein
MGKSLLSSRQVFNAIVPLGRVITGLFQVFLRLLYIKVYHRLRLKKICAKILVNFYSKKMIIMSKEQDETVRSRHRKNHFGDAREQRSKPVAQPGVFFQYQTAFCEGCKKHIKISDAPNNRKKGWRCKECLNND